MKSSLTDWKSTQSILLPVPKGKEGILASLSLPLEKLVFNLIDRPFPESKEAEALRLALWEKRLQTLQSKLKEKGIQTTIQKDQEGFSELLNQAGKGLLTEGAPMLLPHTITQMPDGTVRIDVSSAKYSVLNALRDPTYRQKVEEELGATPLYGMGLGTLIKTKEGDLVFTHRPAGVSYPNTLYAAGGGTEPGQQPRDAVIDEVGKELGLQEGKDYSLAEAKVFSIVVDRNCVGSGCQRPEILVLLETKLSNQEVFDAYNAYKKREGKEPDVDGIAFVSSDAIVNGSALVNNNSVWAKHADGSPFWEKRDDGTPIIDQPIALCPPMIPAFEDYPDFVRHPNREARFLSSEIDLESGKPAAGLPYLAAPRALSGAVPKEIPSQSPTQSR